MVNFAAMLTKTRAIVLHSLKYGEKRMIVDMLTREHGRVEFIVSVSHSAKAKMRKQFFQPLTMLEIECDLRQRVQLQRLREVRIVHPYATIPFDQYKLSLLFFIAEVLSASTRGEQQNQNLYDYVEASMLWLDGCPGSYANFHLVFMMRLTRFIGFLPNIEGYREGDVFDIRAAEFTSAVPLHRDFIAAADAARISTLMRMNYDTMHLFRMSRDDRNRIVDVLLTYYKMHVPNFPELRSLAVVKQLFEDK